MITDKHKNAILNPIKFEMLKEETVVKVKDVYNMFDGTVDIRFGSEHGPILENNEEVEELEVTRIICGEYEVSLIVKCGGRF